MNNNTNNSKKPGDTGNQPSRIPRISMRTWLIILGAFILFDLFFYGSQMSIGGKSQPPQITVSYTTFLTQVQNNNVSTAHIQDSAVDGNFHKAYRDPSTGKMYPRYQTTVLPELYRLVVPILDQHHVQVTQEAPATSGFGLLGLIFQVLPFLLLIGLFYFGARSARNQQQGVFGFGKSRAKQYSEEKPRTTFADVAGVEAAKAELKEIVDFLTEPMKYHRLGARIPRGVLLVGPPGTGKTLLARAVAGEAHVPFFSISSSEFVELFVGVGASRVRDLFDKAKAVAPAIVFVDEIDAIGGRRSSGALPSGGNDEREQTLNQLLTSMDGFEPNESVIVIGATNRPDVLDPALLRPGRFDREVTLDPPDRRGRLAILKIHTRNIPLDPSVDLDVVAQGTPGMTGADLANLANEAALEAARKGESSVRNTDFDEALDRITLGSATSPLMNEDERRITAYHEGGHTLIALILPDVDPVHRVTIIPRGRSLGVTQFRPVDDRRNYRRDYLLNRMAVGMGGRAAEEVAIGDITSGAMNDFQQVTALARTMVTQLGMAEELPPAYFGGNNGGGLGGNPYNPFETREYSEVTASKIDEAVERLVNEAHERAIGVLRDNRTALDAIATTLMQEESLDRNQLTEIVNAHRRPGEEPLPTPTGPPTPLVDSAVPQTTAE